MSGILRTQIMDNCPEEFSEDLKAFIDDIEGKVNKIKDLMDITSIKRLSEIEAAYDKLEELADDLY